MTLILLLKGLFNTLSNKVEKARIAGAEKTSDVKFITRAVKPTQPIRQNMKQIILLAGVVGFMVSLFLAFFVNYLEGARQR